MFHADVICVSLQVMTMSLFIG